jgi:hypothetical protein
MNNLEASKIMKSEPLYLKMKKLKQMARNYEDNSDVEQPTHIFAESEDLQLIRKSLSRFESKCVTLKPTQKNPIASLLLVSGNFIAHLAQFIVLVFQFSDRMRGEVPEEGAEQVEEACSHKDLDF